MNAATPAGARGAHPAVVVGWSIIATTCAGLAAVGAGVDQLLLESHRHRLYDWALSKWLRLSDVRVADLPGRLAGLVLRGWSSLASTRMRAWLWPLALSAVLTAVAALIGRSLRFAAPGAPGVMAGFSRHLSWYVSQLLDGHYVPALLTNCAFDFVTVLVFVATLRRIRDSRSGLGRASLMLAAAAVAVLLAFANLAAAHLATIAVWGPYHDSDLRAASAGLWHFLTFRIARTEATYFDDVAYASTTMLPMLSFLTMLLLLLFAKGLLSLALHVTVHWLRLIADTHPRDVRDKLRPFLLLGTLIGITGAVAKAVYDISSALAK